MNRKIRKIEFKVKNLTRKTIFCDAKEDFHKANACSKDIAHVDGAA